MQPAGNSFFVRLFTPTAVTVQTGNLILGFLPLLLVSVLASTPLAKYVSEKVNENTAVRYLKVAACALIMVLCVAALASNSYNPFIYFRF